MLDLSINPQQESQKIIDFIKSALSKTPFQKLIIALSGGIDSSVSTALAIRALSVQNVHIVHLPYGQLTSQGSFLAQKLLTKLNISKDHTLEIDIKPIVDQIATLDRNIDNIRLGNIMARVRMIILYDLAKKYHSLVSGTENKTEHLLGYFTRFGDEASDVEPIRHLYKTQVKHLATFLEIPSTIIQAPPTAGLWPGQTDEGEFGFSYDQADPILYLKYDKEYSPEKIIQEGFSPDLVATVLKRAEDNRFKHELPYTL